MNDGGDAIDSIASFPTHSLTTCTARLVPESQIWYCYVVLVANVVRRVYALGLHTVRKLNMICRNYVLRANVTSDHVTAYGTCVQIVYVLGLRCVCNILTKYSWLTNISDDYDIIQMEDLSLIYECQEYEEF